MDAGIRSQLARRPRHATNRPRLGWRCSWSCAILLSIAGCAALPQADDAAPRPEKQYVTGSNLPAKDRNTVATKAVDKEEFERARLEMPPKSRYGN